MLLYVFVTVDSAMPCLRSASLDCTILGRPSQFDVLNRDARDVSTKSGRDQSPHASQWMWRPPGRSRMVKTAREWAVLFPGLHPFVLVTWCKAGPRMLPSHSVDGVIGGELLGCGSDSTVQIWREVAMLSTTTLRQYVHVGDANWTAFCLWPRLSCRRPCCLQVMQPSRGSKCRIC